MKTILPRIFAVWTVITFTVTLLIEALLLFLTGFLKEPRRTEVFRRISIVWIRVFLFISGCWLKVKGQEYFRKKQVYIVTCNHNSFLDVPVLTPFVPGPNKTIAKAEMARIPIFGLVYKRGSILVDRKDKLSRQHSYIEMKQVLDQGMHMCIYPEGTRNKTSLPLNEFHNGAFKLSVEHGTPIIPALIFNTRKILPTDRPFYFKPGKIELHFLPEIKAAPGESFESLKERVHQVMGDYYVANGGAKS